MLQRLGAPALMVHEYELRDPTASWAGDDPSFGSGLCLILVSTLVCNGSYGLSAPMTFLLGVGLVGYTLVFMPI